MWALNTWESVYRQMLGEQGRVRNGMDKLISTLENDAYTMMVHKRSLNYTNSWCEEAKRFFSPLENCLNTHFLKRCRAAEASQHGFAVKLICRALRQSPFAGKMKVGGFQSQRLIKWWVRTAGVTKRWLKFFAEMVHCGAGCVATRAKTGHMGLFRKLGGGEKLKIPGAEKLCWWKWMSGSFGGPQRGVTELGVMGWWESENWVWLGGGGGERSLE